MKKLGLTSILIVLGVPSVQSIFGNIQAKVAFPEGYRSWVHVKSVLYMEGHVNCKAFGGIHHVYANDEAIAALKEGKPFAN